MQDLNSNSFEFKFEWFELGQYLEEPKNDEDFWRNLDKSDKNCEQDLKVKLEVE